MIMKSSVFIFLAIFFAFSLSAQQGKVFDNLSMKSSILGMERKYAVYLPPDYESSERSYPVLYLLHGSGDDQSGWIQFGEVLRIADKAILEGSATAMVIVMPDGSAGKKGYFNDPQGNWRYEDFFFEEFMPFVEKEYRIRAEKRYRAVSGLSMGGGGTFIYALHHPELFSSACPLSASCGPLSMDDMDRYLERGDMHADSAEQKEAYFRRHSALALVNELPAEKMRSVNWYIDCGDDDFLYEGNSLIHIAMRKKQVPHEYRVRDGAHNWTYWRESLPEVLSFISDHFHQH
jgi:enterochelin esterase-like enzyme